MVSWFCIHGFLVLCSWVICSFLGFVSWFNLTMLAGSHSINSFLDTCAIRVSSSLTRLLDWLVLAYEPSAQRQISLFTKRKRQVSLLLLKFLFYSACILSHKGLSKTIAKTEIKMGENLLLSKKTETLS